MSHHSSRAARTQSEETGSVEGYQWQSDFAIQHDARGYAEACAKGYGDAFARGFVKGFAKGMVRALLIALRARKISVSAEDRERIMGCTDLEQLELWVERCVIVDTIDEVFA